MAREILDRVCGGRPGTARPSERVAIRPALLHGYQRRRVKQADFPAIVPAAPAAPAEGACVRGTVVTGLTDADMHRLNVFEGDMYTRVCATVHVLAPAAAQLEAQVYVWTCGLHLLEDEEWDFDHFVRDKMVHWIGPASFQEYIGSGAPLSHFPVAMLTPLTARHW